MMALRKGTSGLIVQSENFTHMRCRTCMWSLIGNRLAADKHTRTPSEKKRENNG
jgi:hypothetical protein